MSRLPLPVLPLSLVSAVLLFACGEEGSYELSWTIGGQAVESVRDCSARGLDSVEVEARRGTGGSRTSVFACYSPDRGAVGAGPGLEPGPISLTVYGLTASALRITDPVTTTVDIPESGLSPVVVDIPEPPQCRDGVDNDRDGLVDLLDTGCDSGDDPSEDN